MSLKNKSNLAPGPKAEFNPFYLRSSSVIITVALNNLGADAIRHANTPLFHSFNRRLL